MVVSCQGYSATAFHLLWTSEFDERYTASALTSAHIKVALRCLNKLTHSLCCNIVISSVMKVNALV